MANFNGNYCMFVVFLCGVISGQTNCRTINISEIILSVHCFLSCTVV